MVTDIGVPSHNVSRLSCAGGVSLAIEKFGDGPPQVVFAHGFGQTRDAWTSCATATAAAGWTCMTYDARGHGDSDWLESGDYAVDQLSSDLQRVCAHAGAAPVVVGASMGGLVGIAMAGADPGSCRGLVLVDITPRWEPAGVERILEFMRAHPTGFNSIVEAADAIAAYLPHRGARKSPERLRKLLIASADGRLRWHWDPRMLAPIAEDGVRHQADLLDAAKRIRVPTLLISGAASDVVSESTINEFLELVPHARHAIVPRATHMVAGDENSQFTRLVLDFLASMSGT
ncbi:MAG: alpha/beta hydrolase [Xanthomonadales bacterium]|nr:alpha/beta hydrolase [Xanthomonadales bacterium]